MVVNDGGTVVGELEFFKKKERILGRGHLGGFREVLNHGSGRDSRLSMNKR